MSICLHLPFLGPAFVVFHLGSAWGLEVGAGTFCGARDALEHTVVEDGNRSLMPFLMSYEWIVCIACIDSFAAFIRSIQSHFRLLTFERNIGAL